MRILFLNYEFPPLGGGAGNANYYLFREFEKNTSMDLSINFVTASTEGFKITSFSDKIHMHYLDIGKKGKLHDQSMKDLLLYSYKAYKYAKKLISKHSYDFIHAFFGIPCGYIAMKLGLPYLVSLRGSDVPFHNPKYEWLDKLFFESLSRKIWAKSAFVVANSNGLRETALKTSPKQSIELIFNGVDTEFYSPCPKVPHEKLRVISVGRISKIKGYDVLIKALSKLSDKVELTLIGDGPELHTLQNQARELGFDVNFASRLEKEKVVEYLQQSDVYMLTSLSEGMSNSLLEAMSCGLPIVTTPVGGADELLSDNGFIIEKESEEAILKAVRLYLTNKELRISQGEKSRAIAKKFSWAQVSQDYYQLYQKIVSEQL